MRLMVTGVLFCVVAALASTGESGTPPVDASTDSVQCNSFTLTISAKPAFTFGSAAGPVELTLKGTADGCSVAGPNPVTILPGSKVSGKLTLPSSDCNTLIGTSPFIDGTLTIKWKTNERLIDSKSVTTPAAFTTGFFNAPWGTSYVQGQLAGASTSVTGSFAGSDGGTGSSATVLISEDLGTLNSGCASSGVKVLHAGLGQLNLR